MSFHLIFDSAKCQGYANCLIEAPELWDFDEDENRAVLRLDLVSDESLRGKAEASARCCPAQAIQIVCGTS
jgi:ferredoxin